MLDQPASACPGVSGSVLGAGIHKSVRVRSGISGRGRNQSNRQEGSIWVLLLRWRALWHPPRLQDGTAVLLAPGCRAPNHPKSPRRAEPGSAQFHLEGSASSPETKKGECWGETRAPALHRSLKGPRSSKTITEDPTLLCPQAEPPARGGRVPPAAPCPSTSGGFCSLGSSCGVSSARPGTCPVHHLCSFAPSGISSAQPEIQTTKPRAMSWCAPPALNWATAAPAPVDGRNRAAANLRPQLCPPWRHRSGLGKPASLPLSHRASLYPTAGPEVPQVKSCNEHRQSPAPRPSCQPGRGDRAGSGHEELQETTGGQRSSHRFHRAAASHRFYKKRPRGGGSGTWHVGHQTQESTHGVTFSFKWA